MPGHIWLIFKNTGLCGNSTQSRSKPARNKKRNMVYWYVYVQVNRLAKNFYIFLHFSVKYFMFRSIYSVRKMQHF